MLAREISGSRLRIGSSNNTKESTDDVVHRLSGLGLSVKKEEVMTSLGACGQLVDDRKLRYVYVLTIRGSALT